MLRLPLLLLLLLLLSASAGGVERQDVTFKVFQFPPNMIPRIDGNTDDWAIVPDSYAIGMDQLENTEAPGGHGKQYDPKNLDVRVKVGWVKGLNRLYFLYQAYDNYWDFSRTDLHNDIFEVVVDGDLSGGPLIDIDHRDVWTPEAVGEMSIIDPRQSRSDAYFSYQGDQAQNYHIFTPAHGKDWAMAWGCAQYTKELPYANHAYPMISSPAKRASLYWSFGSLHSTMPAAKAQRERSIDYDDVNSSAMRASFSVQSTRPALLPARNRISANMDLEPMSKTPGK